LVGPGMTSIDGGMMVAGDRSLWNMDERENKRG
jgi:hypothetical protein